MAHAPDWYNLYAHRKLGLPEEWHWFRLEAIGYNLPPAQQATMVEGAVAPISTRGKRKGHRLWRNRDKATEHKFVVTRDTIRSLKAEWEAETGLCHDCAGDGQRSRGWSAAEGTLWEPCPRCGATGRRPEERAA
jgi:hypothetical protein